MNNFNFTRNLVKGRIAEVIFSQMYRHSQKFTVLEFGYEKVIPDLLQYNHGHDDPIIETLRTAPDFAVINRRIKQVHLIEVKYRRHLRYEETLEIARRMHESWNPSFLFVASLDGFFIDSVSDIIHDNGHIARLSVDEINADTQEEYIQILREYESGH